MTITISHRGFPPFPRLSESPAFLIISERSGGPSCRPPGLLSQGINTLLPSFHTLLFPWHHPWILRQCGSATSNISQHPRLLEISYCNENPVNIVVINILDKGQPLVSSFGSLNVNQFADSAEMVAVDRKCNSQRKQLRSAKKSPKQNLPILESLFAKNT
jgi:hypothetical protein